MKHIFVSKFKINGWSTDIWLEGLIPSFNSVMFQFADDRQFEVDDFWWFGKGYGPKTLEICNGCKAFINKNLCYGGFSETASCSLNKKELVNCLNGETYFTPFDCPVKTRSIKGLIFD